MKKLLTNKKLMSSLSVFLVLSLILTNLGLGGVKAKAEATEPSAGSSEIVGYRKVSDANGQFDKTNSAVTSADGAVVIKKDIENRFGGLNESSGEKVNLQIAYTKDIDKAKSCGRQNNS